MLRGSLRAAPRRERLVIQSLRGLLLCGIDRSSLEFHNKKNSACVSQSRVEVGILEVMIVLEEERRRDLQSP